MLRELHQSAKTSTGAEAGVGNIVLTPLRRASIPWSGGFLCAGRPYDTQSDRDIAMVKRYGVEDV